jgi:hypothetical protein
MTIGKIVEFIVSHESEFSDGSHAEEFKARATAIGHSIRNQFGMATMQELKKNTSPDDEVCQAVCEEFQALKLWCTSRKPA